MRINNVLKKAKFQFGAFQLQAISNKLRLVCEIRKSKENQPFIGDSIVFAVR